MNLKDTYNKIAEDWHKDHTKDTWWVEGTDAFVRLMPEGGSVLDAGCGSGMKAKYLAHRGLRVLGVDFSEKFIDIARGEVPEAQFAVLNLYDIDTLTQTFDGVFMQASLLHIEKKDVRLVLEKTLGLLKSGGFLYVAVKSGRPGGAEEEIKTEDDYGYEYNRFFSYFSAKEMKEHFAVLGLTVVYEHIPTGNTTQWIQLIGKRA